MTSLNEIQKIIKKQIDNIEFDKVPDELYDPIEYTINIGGKRLRPALCLMGCEMFGGDIADALHPALGIEFFHNFTLLHDDIMDKAPLRRGKETVYNKWNTNTAILAGDTMMAIAYDYIMKAPEEGRTNIFSVFNKTAIEVCEGQQYDMNYESQKDVTIIDYLEMIRLKTAVLLAGSLKIGALIGGANEKEAQKLYSYGENIGIAFQLKDDLLDVYSNEDKFGKKLGGDIISNKKTFLYLKAFELARGKTYDSLWFYFNQKFENTLEKVKGVKEIYEELKIKEITGNEMKKYSEKAMLYLESIAVDDSRKNELKTFTEKLMIREY